MPSKLLAVLGVLALIQAAHAKPVSLNADAALDDLERRYLDEFGRFAPVDATLIGDHRHDAELDDLSARGRAARLNWDKELLDHVGHIDRATLSRDHQVDAALLANQLRYDIWQITRSKHWLWDPLLYNDKAGDALFNLMARDFAPLPERLRSAAARLMQLPRLYEQERANLSVARVPRVYAEQAVSRNRGLSELLDEFLVPNLNKLSGQDREDLLTAIKRARTANAEQQTWLEAVVLPHAAGDFRVGPAMFDEELRYVLQSPMSRKEIRRRALLELQTVRREMYQIAVSVLASRSTSFVAPERPAPDEQQKIIRAALDLAAAEHPSREDFIDAAKVALQRATDFVRERDVLTLPTAPVEVVATPVFMRRPSPASCENPGPLDAEQKTFYDVSPVPEDWSPEKAESFLREYNSRAILGLTVHEAMPGHYVQFAAANQHASKFRGLFESGSFVEGWAVYAERMMVDTGFDDWDPLMRLGNRKTYLRSVVNALIDQGIHADGMTRDEAMRLLTHDAFQEEAEAEAKWDRARLSETQLSTYFVGVQEHFELRRQAERRWGDKFTLKRYHDQVLSYGSIPVRHVRALMFDLPIEP
ncbi:MAG: DUF885 domain-containing protein [Proteobacteria bacterium]|nr:DUF885 domain-containing protein [Pseudomonadota bacterium]